MHPFFRLTPVAAALACSGFSTRADEPRTLPTVEVSATRELSTTLPSADAAREELSRVPGGTAVQEMAPVREGRVSTVADTFAFTPGVFAASRFGAEESRLSIRGSGLQRTFHMRGIALLQDGVPLNLADGSGDFQAVEPLASRYVEVWRGANALQYGAANLGGAVNFVSRSGRDEPGFRLRGEAGSYGYLRAQADYAAASEQLDGVASLSEFHLEGFRAHSRQETQRFFGNLGWRISGQTESRFFATLAKTDSELPGALTRAEMSRDPRQADPAAVKGDQHRNFDLARLANLTSVSLGDSRSLEAGVFYAYKSLFHPIYQVLEQRSGDMGASLRYVDDRAWSGRDNRLVLGTTLQRGQIDDDRFLNVSGNKGARSGESEQTATTNAVFGEIQHAFLPDTRAIIGGQYAWADRRLKDLYLADRVDNSFDADYSHFSPKVGVLHELTPAVQLYANWSRSFEPPSFGELAGGPNITQVDAQRASTLEVGSRGHWQGAGLALDWDASLYAARVRDELLSLSDANGNPLGTVNADRTQHEGLELGLEARLAEHWRLRAKLLANRFRFDDDPVYGNKRLAGIPDRSGSLELLYTGVAGLYAGPVLQGASGSWVDHANTLRASGYGLLGFKLGQRPEKGLAWFVEGRNLLDRTYVATTGVMADAKGMDQRQFYPGDGVAWYAGLEYPF
ncbi:TonB-dependent receptor [Niveibacterium sp. SC-1]|uniref:TonB-dependent receptor family protein n=1 Tax=Niveibacterium sp. SC-1 TaxID=3135646 RepID=UPI00311D9CD4